jgi:hypothetical protein
LTERVKIDRKSEKRPPRRTKRGGFHHGDPFNLFNILFSLAVAESVALGALCEPFSAHVNADRELIPLWLEFGVAIGANEGRIHQNKVACNRNNCYRDRDDVPGRVIGFTKPVDLAGGEGERRQKSKYKK